MSELSNINLDGEKIELRDDKARVHIDDNSNPHNVTKEQIGLPYADNTSDMDKPISTLQQEAFDAINKKIGTAELNTDADTLIGAINEANSIAKGRNQSVAYESYEEMVTAFNDLDSTVYNVGQNIYIGITGVPDLWVYGIVASKNTYTYTSDEDLVELISSNTYQQIGHYQIAFLETQKVDLTEFTTHVQNTNNPHGVTKAQVGLGNVPNVATNNQTPTYTLASTVAELVSGEKLSVAFGKIAKFISHAISKFTSYDTELEELNSNLMVYDNTFTMYIDECITNAISSWWQGEKVFFNINAQYSKNLEAGSWYPLLTFNKKPNVVFYYPCVYNYDKAGLAKIDTNGVFWFRPSGDAYLSGQPVIVDGIYHL